MPLIIPGSSRAAAITAEQFGTRGTRAVAAQVDQVAAKRGGEMEELAAAAANRVKVKHDKPAPASPPLHEALHQIHLGVAHLRGKTSSTPITINAAVLDARRAAELLKRPELRHIDPTSVRVFHETNLPGVTAIIGRDNRTVIHDSTGALLHTRTGDVLGAADHPIFGYGPVSLRLKPDALEEPLIFNIGQGDAGRSMANPNVYDERAQAMTTRARAPRDRDPVTRAMQGDGR